MDNCLPGLYKNRDICMHHNKLTNLPKLLWFPLVAIFARWSTQKKLYKALFTCDIQGEFQKVPLPRPVSLLRSFKSNFAFPNHPSTKVLLICFNRWIRLLLLKMQRGCCNYQNTECRALLVSVPSDIYLYPAKASETSMSQPLCLFVIFAQWSTQKRKDLNRDHVTQKKFTEKL